MKKIRIMHLMLSLETGGMENGVVNILLNSDSSSLENSVCCLEKIGVLGGPLAEAGINIINMSKKPGFSLPLIFKLSRLLARERIDILHTRCWATLVYGYLATRIARTGGLVHSEHGVFNLDHDRRRIIYSHIINKVDQVITVSSSLKKEVQEIVNQPELNIKTILNGVDTGKFKPERNNSYMEELGLKSTDFVVGSAGRLEKVKNYGLFLDCLARIDDRSVKGVLVGDGPERMKLEKMADDLKLGDRMIFLGTRQDMSEIMPLFDVYVNSSHGEGMSNTILEAMASGVPVVATRVGGNPEIVRHGETGYLVKDGDAEDMKAAVMKLLKDRESTALMKLKAREMAVDRYSLSRMVSEYGEVYHLVYARKIGSLA